MLWICFVWFCPVEVGLGGTSGGPVPCPSESTMANLRPLAIFLGSVQATPFPMASVKV